MSILIEFIPNLFIALAFDFILYITGAGVLRVISMGLFKYQWTSQSLLDTKQVKWKVGQTWSTFMPLVSIAEALDFGGAHVGQTFVRQGQIRYTDGGLELAIENASTQSAEPCPSLPSNMLFSSFANPLSQAMSLFRIIWDHHGMKNNWRHRLLSLVRMYHIFCSRAVCPTVHAQ